jgi:hypothetical protein
MSINSGNDELVKGDSSVLFQGSSVEPAEPADLRAIVVSVCLSQSVTSDPDAYQ